MQKKSKAISYLAVIVGVGVSITMFGITPSLAVSIIFILIALFKVIQDLENTGALAAFSIIAPIITKFARARFLVDIDYSNLLLRINDYLKANNVEIILEKETVDTVIIYIILILIYYGFTNRDKSALGKSLSTRDDEFRDKTFIEKNDIFCKHLEARLNAINSDLNWNSDTYTPISAEVVISNGSKSKIYDDMLKCLKKNRNVTAHSLLLLVQKIKFSNLGKIKLIHKITSFFESKLDIKRVYLVLGDPGSGKSVSLRKLCADLLKENSYTGKTPVYINLNSWTADGKQWSASNLPSAKDLTEFIKKELYKDGDQFTDNFLDVYFDKMWENGRWYFIFDSFDEMPCFMNGDDNRDLIKYMSRLFSDYLSDVKQCGGIVASRLYNRPSEAFNHTYSLRLQNFSNSKIRLMIKKYNSGNVDAVIRDLFKNRPDLINLCRNPFHLSLLINYIQNHNNEFPKNQFDLFRDLIDNRLKNSGKKINAEGIEIEDVNKTAIDLALGMQNERSRGLDFPVERLYQGQSNKEKRKLEKCLSILEYVKLCRMGDGRKSISFVHRRFQEFFFVDAIKQGIIQINEKDYSGILDNTGIRDALVLYCQIGTADQVKDIISFCYNIIENNLDKIKNIQDEGCVQFVNALYFLTESFCNRKELLGERIKIITGLSESLTKETDYIVQMAIVNSMSLLSSEDIQKITLKVFKLHNRWLNRTIVSNCQFIEKLDLREEISFCHYFYQMSYRDYVKEFFNIDFSLSLSDCFKYVRFIHAVTPAIPAGEVLLIIILLLYGYFQRLYDFIESISGQFFSIPLRESIEKFNVWREAEMSAHTITDTLYFMAVTALIILTLLFLSIFLEANRERLSRSRRDIKISEMSLSFAPSLDIQNRSMLTDLVITLLFSLFIICIGIMSGNHSYLYVSFTQRVLISISLLLMGVVVIVSSIREIVMPFFDRLRKFSIKKLRRIIIWFFIALLYAVSIIISNLLLILGLLAIAIIICLIPVLISILICRYNGIQLTQSNLEVVITGVILIGFVVVILIMAVVRCVYLAVDIIWIKRHVTMTISREQFVKEIRRLHSNFTRRKYLHELMSADAKLEGTWPDNQRINLDDDIFNRDLAQWDSKDYRLDNLFSTGFY